MSIRIYILNASGHLEFKYNALKKVARSTVNKVQRNISLDNVDIVIRESENPEIYKDIDGVGGWCPTGFFIQLSVDVNHPSFLSSPEKIIERTLIHELHHAARMQSGIAMNRGTFLEYIFSEGLADNFVYELTGDKPIWIPALDKEEEKELMRRIKKKYNSKFTQKDHTKWFIIGSKKQSIPQFTGYALGFDIVKDYLEEHPGESAASLVNVPVAEILDLK